MRCKIAVALIHEYLDGDLSADQTAQLRVHLAECSFCQAHLESLQRTDAFVSAIPVTVPPSYLCDRIMDALPKSKRGISWTKWVRRHPAVSAAALFLVVMVSSFVAMWNQNQMLSVSGDLDNLIIEGNRVIIPEGKTVNGDLIITNGTAQVLGDVEGNLTVIDGSVLLASTAHITGNVKQIDRAVDWFWYKVSSWFGTITYSS
ncbi:MAG: zf-HC2 domain-containing protein [Candidatus Cohnella colombiensis]|uniref:Anti-sigma-W factor RsiW n=1 Tax=Candidatus Cohnella colombiensis TaxID=3121368 RepID=A0AA95EVR0_9BACL|nr:MAG: zf-HC2 domain-containing protein [Cohnella sp.]